MSRNVNGRFPKALLLSTVKLSTVMLSTVMLSAALLTPAFGQMPDRDRRDGRFGDRGQFDRNQNDQGRGVAPVRPQTPINNGQTYNGQAGGYQGNGPANPGYPQSGRGSGPSNPVAANNGGWANPVASNPVASNPGPSNNAGWANPVIGTQGRGYDPRADDRRVDPRAYQGRGNEYRGYNRRDDYRGNPAYEGRAYEGRGYEGRAFEHRAYGNPYAGREFDRAFFGRGYRPDYDRYYHARYVNRFWNDREERAYRLYLAERRWDYIAWDSCDPYDQDDYWDWRETHPDRLLFSFGIGFGR